MQQTPPDRGRGKPELNLQVAEIKAALQLGATIARLTGIQLEPCGSGAKACCPFHRESTPSFFVNDITGRYKCFGSGCGAGGDVIQFVREWYSVSFSEAMRRARELAGLPPPVSGSRLPARPVPGSAAWRGVVDRTRPARPAPLQPSTDFLQPVPAEIVLPKPGRRVQIQDRQKQRMISMVPTHVHAYRSECGSVLCLVLRGNARDGRKFFIQAKWAAGTEPAGWVLARFPKQVARPVYGLSDLGGWSRRGGILLVEGEKTRDAAAKLLPCRTSELLSISAMGGGGALFHADWSPLARAVGSDDRDPSPPIRCIIWPDADKPVPGRDGRIVDRQLRFAQDAAGSMARAFGDSGQQLRFSRIIPPAGVDGGWDLADALEQGWTEAQARKHLEHCAVPLELPNAAQGPAPAAPPARHHGDEDQDWRPAAPETADP